MECKNKLTEVLEINLVTKHTNMWGKNILNYDTKSNNLKDGLILLENNLNIIRKENNI